MLRHQPRRMGGALASISAGRSMLRPYETIGGARRENHADRVGTASHFTLLSQPASQAAETYIAKHSRAKGIKPR